MNYHYLNICLRPNRNGGTSLVLATRLTLLGLALLLTVSCAHRSGRHKNKKDRTERSERQKGESADEPIAINNSRVENKRSDKALEGSEIFARYNSAVFMILTSDGEHNFQGSGFFINSDGYAVSNYHVFKGTYQNLEAIKLAGSDEIYKVTEVVAKSESEDFIIFKINCTNTNYIPIAADKPKIGEKVYAIGSPKGLENTFSSGEVSQWRDTNLMQISAQIDHGSSGGALINEYGEVVGITSGTFDEGSQANLNYAWSIDVIKPYLKGK